MRKIPKIIMYNVFKRYDSQGSTENAKKSGRRKSLNDCHVLIIIRILRADRKASLSDITNRFNDSEYINVCKKTMWGFIRSNGYRRCACRKKIRIRQVNKSRGARKNDGGHLMIGKKLFNSDESQIVIGNDNRVYIWRKSDDTFRPECICPGVNRKICHHLGLHYIQWCRY